MRSGGQRPPRPSLPKVPWFLGTPQRLLQRGRPRPLVFPGRRHLARVGPTACRSEGRNLVSRVSVLALTFLPGLLKPSAWHIAGGR